MHRLASFLLIVVLTSSCRSTFADILLTDSGFDPSDWSASEIFVDNANLVSATQELTGGNSGAYRRTVHELNGIVSDFARLWIFHENTSATFDPSTQFGIGGVKYSVSQIHFNPPFLDSAVGHHLALRQNGVVYMASQPMTFSNTIWSRNSLAYSSHLDFVDVLSLPAVDGDGILENPDFSDTGSPITFGYISNNRLSLVTNTDHGIDNWTLRITGIPEPNSFSFIAILFMTTFLGMILQRRR